MTSDNIEGHRGRVSCGFMTVIATSLCFIPRCIWTWIKVMSNFFLPQIINKIAINCMNLSGIISLNIRISYITQASFRARFASGNEANVHSRAPRINIYIPRGERKQVIVRVADRCNSLYSRPKTAAQSYLNGCAKMRRTQLRHRRRVWLPVCRGVMYANRCRRVCPLYGGWPVRYGKFYCI